MTREIIIAINIEGYGQPLTKLIISYNNGVTIMPEKAQNSAQMTYFKREERENKKPCKSLSYKA